MALWQRTLWVIVAGQLLTSLGSSFVFPFMPLFIQEIGVPDLREATLWAAAANSVQAVSLGIMAPIWGTLADRRGRKPMLVRSLIGCGVFIGAAGFSHSPIHLLICRTLQGTVSGTISAASALVAAISPRERRGYSLGMVQLSVWVGTAIGPVFGGLAAAALGYRACFWMAGVLMTVAGLATYVLAKEGPRPVSAPTRSSAGRFAAVRTLGSAAPAIALIALSELSFNAIQPILPLVAERALPVDPDPAIFIGILFGTTALTASIGAAVLGRWSDRIGYRRVILVSAATGALLHLVQPLSYDPAVLVILRAVTGFALGGLMAASNAQLAMVTASSSVGLAYGLADLARCVGRVIGPLAAAYLATQIDVGLGFVFAAAVLASVGVIALASHPSERVAVV
jgi:DHA1 family multidrug resistance protein-like MFS transporter